MKPADGTLTIQEVARAFGLSVHTLRYYERIGLIHRVARARSGHRRYTEADGHWLAFLNKLRATGMRIRDMQAYATLQRQGDGSLARRVAMLEALRDQTEARVAELTENLKLVRFKIETYTAQLGRQRRQAGPRAAPAAGARAM
jgi:DNA-binding transcriptional MerR regulator